LRAGTESHTYLKKPRKDGSPPEILIFLIRERNPPDGYRASSEETEIPPRVKQSTRCRNDRARRRNDKAWVSLGAGHGIPPFRKKRERMGQPSVD